MSERKAINKYYPPDWDPSQVPKKKKNTNANAEKVRLMVPFSMKCLQCSEYISARRKFNARKEITSEKYMGIKIIKFHIKCPRCNHSLSFQTDPKSAGFIPVAGCARNYESMNASEPVKPLETEDEIFERLERQEKENQQFQEQQQRRKNNPFWQKHTQDSSKDMMSNLEDKLIEQKREQEVHDHLMYLQAKSAKIQQSGGEDSLINQAISLAKSSTKRDHEGEVESLAKRNKTHVEPPKVTIPTSFTVKKGTLKKKSEFDGTKKAIPEGSEKSSEKSSEKTSVSHLNQPSEIKTGTSVFGEYGSSDEE